jgi:ketosteroid isomerase-like protein
VDSQRERKHRPSAAAGLLAVLIVGGLLAPAVLSAPRAQAGEAGLRRRSVVHWVQAYARAWENKDADAAVAIFTSDALYQAVPGVAEQTFRGREAIHRYWADVTAAQQDISVRWGEPVIQGRRAAVELWATFRQPQINPEGEHWVTIVESNLLTFTPDGRLCSRNVEYWNLNMGRLTPPRGWGSST